ncbi:MAG: tryptophan-rich sensory protein [Firmicutes bacterium]|nr:tryptophan-rich sensory protein [Bacillota bacterium]
MKTLKNIITLFGPLVCGIIVGLLINTDTYQIINKPPFSPPGIVFPIVWSILYILMGISLYAIIKDKCNKKSINLFLAQLLINLIWPFLFFNFELYYFSALWILILIYYVYLMTRNFLSIKKIAGYLQFPYLIWLIFALYLNLGVAFLN